MNKKQRNIIVHTVLCIYFTNRKKYKSAKPPSPKTIYPQPPTSHTYTQPPPLSPQHKRAQHSPAPTPPRTSVHPAPTPPRTSVHPAPTPPAHSPARTFARLFQNTGVWELPFLSADIKRAYLAKVKSTSYGDLGAKAFLSSLAAVRG